MSRTMLDKPKKASVLLPKDQLAIDQKALLDIDPKNDNYHLKLDSMEVLPRVKEKITYLKAVEKDGVLFFMGAYTREYPRTHLGTCVLSRVGDTFFLYKEGDRSLITSYDLHEEYKISYRLEKTKNQIGELLRKLGINVGIEMLSDTIVVDCEEKLPTKILNELKNLTHTQELNLKVEITGEAKEG